MEPPALIRALTDPVRHDRPTGPVRVVETHISWVILTGRFAYKIKKPVDLGFLDFSTLERRKRACEEELRLNRRFAPDLYLTVVPITGTPDRPVLGGGGTAIEYAVQMHQFPEDARLDRMLVQARLTASHVDSAVRALASFHASATVAPVDSPFGAPDAAYAPMRQNFEQIDARLGAMDAERRGQLKAWTEQSFETLRSAIGHRKLEGAVRECHGDAHLANMAWWRDRAVLFDCIEFSAELRWIDVMSDLAFLVMDLAERGRVDFARRALNAYLETTGDYEGLAVFRLYELYRALVRAKVAAITFSDAGLPAPEREEALARYGRYAAHAESIARSRPTVLVITHGLSGSGKTTFTQTLLERFEIIRVRSDIERKRLHGLAPLASSRSRPGENLYTPEAGMRTYDRLAHLAASILRSGFSVVVDAAFLERGRREQLRAVSQALRVPFVILDLRAPTEILKERIVRRAQAGSDASEAGLAVLEHQLAHFEPISGDEDALVIDADRWERELEAGGHLSKMLIPKDEA